MAAVVHHGRTIADINVSAKPTSFANDAFNLLKVLDALVTDDNLHSSQMMKFTQRDAATPLLLQQRSTPAKVLPSVPGKQTEINIHRQQVVSSSQRKDKDAICSAFLSALKQPVTSAQALPGNVCVVCHTRFSSRTKLFKHLRCKGHGKNCTPTALLLELQALMDLLKNKTYKSHRTQLCYVFWCLQKILTALSHLQPHEARRVARTRAHNGATILHFVVDLWAICAKGFSSKVILETVSNSGTTTKPFPTVMPRVVQILKLLISWAIRSSKISPKSTINKSKLLASSKPVWCGPWFTKHSATSRGEYCGYQNARRDAQRDAQRALDSKSLTEFAISNDTIWTHRDCKPGETALQVCREGSRLLDGVFRDMAIDLVQLSGDALISN